MSYTKILLSIIFCLSCVIGTTSFATEKLLVGRVEKVTVYLPNALLISARVDSGAKTSSLDAYDVLTSTRNGKSFVSFKFKNRNDDKIFSISKPIIRYVKIRNRKAVTDEPFSRRPVIKLKICIANQIQEIEVNLTNRADFNYAMILGRTTLEKFHALIDPQKVFIHKQICQETP